MQFGSIYANIRCIFDSELSSLRLKGVFYLMLCRINQTKKSVIMALRPLGREKRIGCDTVLCFPIWKKDTQGSGATFKTALFPMFSRLRHFIAQGIKLTIPKGSGATTNSGIINDHTNRQNYLSAPNKKVRPEQKTDVLRQ